MEQTSDPLLTNEERILLEKYFSNPDYKDNIKENEALPLFNAIYKADLHQILEIVDKSSISLLRAKETPMFSSVDASIIYSINHLLAEPLTYNELGSLLPGCSSDNIPALKKYGECHGKLLASVGLAKINRTTPRTIMLTKMGVIFSRLNDDERYKMFSKMLLSTGTIKNLMIQSKYGPVSIDKELSSVHNGTTIKRRRNSTRALLKTIDHSFPYELEDRLRNIFD